MKKVLILFHKYPFSTLCITTIWILCLMPIPETPLSHVKLIDKWTHLVMYGGLCLTIWIDRARLGIANNRKGTVIYAVALPIIMGGLIELAQAYCTDGMRSGEWLDWAADTLGVAIGQPIGILLTMCLAKWKRGHAAD